MNQNYGDILQFLQGLLTNKQSTNASQYQQGLAAQQAEYMANLANQLAITNAQGQNAINLQAPQLALQGKEFDTTTKNALQQQMWQQQYAQDQNAQQQNAQRLAQLQSYMYGGGGGASGGGGGASGGGGGASGGAYSYQQPPPGLIQALTQNQLRNAQLQNYPMGTGEAHNQAVLDALSNKGGGGSVY